MEALLKVTVLFTLVLALSLVIERFIEILKAVYDLLDSRLNWHTFWTRQTIRLRDRLEKRMRIFEYVDPKMAASALYRFRDMILNEQGGYAGAVPILSGDLVRAFYIKVVFKCVAIGLGIGLALWLKIDLMGIWQNASTEPGKLRIFIESPTIRFILSGMAVGLGSTPVHKIITMIERRQKKQQQKGGQT